MSSLMLQHSPVRWKEWIPLVTQQQRFRNLIQIVGYNVGSEASKDIAYYYTLHFTTMCAPFYTSEKIAKEHPKWSEINFSAVDPSYGSATGIVVRVWQRRRNEDSMVTVWGVYFSGLSYIGPRIEPNEGVSFAKNTLVFRMHGGYFTYVDCLVKDEPTLARITVLSLNSNDVRRSYSVNALSRLHSIQRSVKESTEESVSLRNKILLGEFPDDEPQMKENSAFLRKLLNQTKPVKVSHEQILDFKKKIEVKKFRVQLLQEQKSQKLVEIRRLTIIRDKIIEANLDEGIRLTDRYYSLHKDVNNLKRWKKEFSEGKENLSSLKSYFWFRQTQLIAELAYIYPIEKVGNRYTICQVHLPNSEDFAGVDEVLLGVALGFTAHVVQRISFIINVPLRYPIMHCGSRSKIVDYIAEKLPDNDREFPLFVRGKNRLPFNYAVYLLNKNIAQLRWYCGIVTSDLRATLPNLETLLSSHFAQKCARKNFAFTSDSITKLASSPRNTFRDDGIPRRFSFRGRDRLSCSLDRGLDKWQCLGEYANSAPNISEPFLPHEARSGDAVDPDCDGRNSAFATSNGDREALVGKEIEEHVGGG